LIASFRPFSEKRILAPPAALAQCQSVRAAPNAKSRQSSDRPLLTVAAVALQDLDLVPVRILDEKESRHQAAVSVKFLDVGGLQPEFLEAAVLGVEIVDRERDVAVAVAVLITASRDPC
jgi:hypothetical protein